MAEDTSLAGSPRFLNEPASRWTILAFDDLLRWAKTVNASDIKVLPRRPVTARINGVWSDATRRGITSSEIFELLEGLTRSAVARSRIVSADDHDFAYEVRINETDKARIRFRGNATGCRDGWSLGAELTLRLIADRPPSMQEISLPDEIYKSCCPQNGLVLFTGITGTGKTTSMAAILREINLTKPWAIATYEQPIEFDLTNMPGAKGPLTQSEIPTHFKSFAVAAKNAARRALDIALVGESRDAETLDAMLALAEMGHRVFSTSHTMSVSATPLRIISAFPHEKHSHAASAFFTVVRMVVQQRLVPRLDPATGQQVGRIALREYLEFDDGMRNRMMKVKQSEIGVEVERLVRTEGLALIDDAKVKFKEGLISDVTMNAIEYEYKDREGMRNLRKEERDVA